MNQYQYDSRRPQTSSSGGPKRYMPTGLPRGNLFQDDGYGDQQWDDMPSAPSGGGGGGSTEKPTGLRHFSTKVCEKVKEKGLTNYNEVADELVADYFHSNVLKHVDVVKQEYDMKNIRRRVYDALNVLLAMNIITKNKKDIRWIGLPASASQEIARLEEEKTRREASIRAKKDALQEMVMQIVSYKNLVERNRRNEHKNGRPEQDTLLHLPFLIINTDKETNVECSVSSDKSEFLFSFDKKFEIHDDFEVLKKMKLACGLDTGNPTDEELITAKSFLPSLHQSYVDEIVTTHKEREAEREEKEKQMLLLAQRQQQMAQMQYYDPETGSMGNRYNRQLQEHLIADEDRNAAAGIMERDEDLVVPMERNAVRGGPMYNSSGYSPQKTTAMRAIQQQPSATRRYYVQKGTGAPGPMGREMSPAIRTISRPYTSTIPQQRMAAGGGTVGAGGGPVKYYVPQPSGAGPGPSSSLTAPRYKIRTPSQSTTPGQRVTYSTGAGGLSSAHLQPGQRIVTQRIVTSGGPHPPGTIVRKVIRKIVVNPGGAKQSPAQQVIQKKMMEQEMQDRKPEMPMTSAQAAAMIQHEPPSDYDYF
ncbi:hypothetical protein B9Z55_004130 [Caenorhabditis nigoni]|uniref:E2F/DP family winged-helix DNA-binding domain-containing protein n=1 Tax=Caenorhabditis nigoni TaxID=1611254 RepID=A0A2G5UV31_9PELO|nr:hypothetical protein B9Z55_004130 [Caenorhabditis nigoni]